MINPTANIGISPVVRSPSFCRDRAPLRPSSSAPPAERELGSSVTAHPHQHPTRNGAPEREKPGHSARHWKQPIITPDDRSYHQDPAHAALSASGFGSNQQQTANDQCIHDIYRVNNDLIVSWNNSPSTTAGIIPAKCGSALNDLCFLLRAATGAKVDANQAKQTPPEHHYYRQIDPNWITTSKVFAVSPSNPTSDRQ